MAKRPRPRTDRGARVERAPAEVKQRKIRKPVKVKPRCEAQAQYCDMIENNDVTICNGLAGTGKTLLAVGMALKLMHENPDVYKKLIMVRPYVHVEGEGMGFLPGDIDDKMSPFTAPMFDSLECFLDRSVIDGLKDSGAIEVCPVAYMRGRTFNNAIIIFDEAQNSRWEHMKMFLTRIGFKSKAIIEGDSTQSDLDKKHQDDNGLIQAVERLHGVEGIATIRMGKGDIQRSPVVKRILERLE